MKRIIKSLLLSGIILFGGLMMVGCNDTYDPKDDLAKEYANYGAYYEIFVRSFADSNGDGVGDFKGIEENLDYLVDLGIEGIWLMPINEADSYHGYDVTDYYKVEQDYGTMEDFVSLLSACHEKGIKVIMDFVINHSSEKNPWFVSSKKAIAGTGSAEDNKYKDFYVWANGTDNRVSKPTSDGKSYWHKDSASGKYYYGYFSGSMPDFNYLNVSFKKEITNIAKYWIDKGIDGFRIDGAAHIFGENEYKYSSSAITLNVEYLASLRNNLNSYAKENYGKNIYIVSECYKDQSIYSEYYGGVDSTFNFDLAEELLSVAQGNSYGYTNDVEKLLTKFNKYVKEGYKVIDAPFLTNHDQDRIASQLSSSKMLRMAAELLCTLEGNPFIYYGEELGMKGVKTDGGNIAGYGKAYDETIRLPFKWGTSASASWIPDTFNKDLASYNDQKDDPSSLYNTYKTLLNLRKNNYALKYGSFASVATSNSNVQAFTRTLEIGGHTYKVLVVMNFNKTGFDYTNLVDGNKTPLYYSLGLDNFTNGTMDSFTTMIFQIEG